MESSSSTEQSFLKPELVASLPSLFLRAKFIVDGLISGMHKSPYHGFSSEFLEYRSYRYGEPAGKIDWRKYARTDRTVVRLFEDETNMFARIILDKSASMNFSSTPNITKYEYARILTASIALILIRQKDAVGLYTYDDDLDFLIHPKSTDLHLRNIISSLENIQPSNGTSCGKAIESVACTINKRGLSIVISDFLDDPENIIKGLRHLKFKKQDIILIWLLDSLENNFSNDGQLEVVDIESGENIILDGVSASRIYAKDFLEHKNKIEQACIELKIDYEMVTTNQNFYKVLSKIVEHRRRLF